MRSQFSRVLLFLDSLLLGQFVTAFIAEKKLKHRQKMLRDEGSSTSPLPAKGNLNKLLERHVDAEQARRQTIEEKARVNLLALTVSSSLIFAGLSFITSDGAKEAFATHRIVAFAFLAPVAYFVIAGIAAMKVLDIGETYLVRVEDEGLDDEALWRLQRLYLKLNQIGTNIKANWASVSFSCLRNAVVCLFAFSGIAIPLLMAPRHKRASSVPTAPGVTVNCCSTPAKAQAALELTGDAHLSANLKVKSMSGLANKSHVCVHHKRRPPAIPPASNPCT